MQAEGWDQDQNSFSFAYAHYLGMCWELSGLWSMQQAICKHALSSTAGPGSTQAWLSQ